MNVDNDAEAPPWLFEFSEDDETEIVAAQGIQGQFARIAQEAETACLHEI